ncbi:MAG TPA: hypothetical protein PLQ19_06925 [Aeromicrobium sp.]|nr:hypothetical protein [Aeromicrobium sp.]
MAQVDDFDDFYASTHRLTLAVTYASCGDQRVADEATVHAYEHAWRRWDVVSSADSVRYAREEAWKSILLSRGAHPLRRKESSGTDRGLVGALMELDPASRRLIALMTIANLDIDTAAAELSLDDEEAIELASRGFGRLEAALGASIDEVGARLGELAGVTAVISMPTAGEIRRSASKGERRNRLLLVLTAMVLVLVGGALVAQGAPLDREVALPAREQIGAETRDIVLDSHNIGTDDLLKSEQVAELRPAAVWSVEGTETDLTNKTPYATCPTKRFADPDPLKVFVRAYSSDVADRVTQSLEISRSEKASEKAFDSLVAAYANCEHPRTRLIDAYTVKRPFGDFKILRLQSYRDPARFFTVGMAQSGSLTSTLVFETPGTKATDVNVFAKVLNDSVARVCADSGGDCTQEFVVARALPPAAASHPEFLGVVDLPPVSTVDSVWSASEPVDVGSQNAAATLCDESTMTGANVVEAKTRLFAIPEAKELPEQFALTQSVAQMSSPAEANKFFDGVKKKINKCPDGDLPAKIDQSKRIRGSGYDGRSWRVGIEVAKDKYAYYRMGVVYRGSAVTQVLFPPAGKYALGESDFRAVMNRAGERLAYAGN